MGTHNKHASSFFAIGIILCLAAILGISSVLFAANAAVSAICAGVSFIAIMLYIYLDRSKICNNDIKNSACCCKGWTCELRLIFLFVVFEIIRLPILATGEDSRALRLLRLLRLVGAILALSLGGLIISRRNDDRSDDEELEV